MRSIRNHGPAGFAIACTLLVGVGCGSEQPFAGGKEQASVHAKAVAVPLEVAIEKQLLQVQTRKNNSTREEMALAIEPLVRDQPWIRIDPGWQVKEAGAEAGSYVTYRTTFVRLPKRGHFMVAVPHVQRTMAKLTGISTTSTLTRIDDEDLLALFAVVDESPEAIDWKLVQVATWALTENVAFSRLRPPPNDGRVHLSGNRPTVDSFEIMKVLDLLSRLGRPKADFALYLDAMDELDALIEQYENFVEANDGRALVPFKRICDFYPFETAVDLVIGSFDRHQSEEGGSVYRRRAFEVLRDDGSPSAIAVIKRVATFEPDGELFKAMQAVVAPNPTADSTPAK